jgi:predicted PurR-regulated permease PerM
MTIQQSPIARFLILTAAFVVIVAGMRTAESLLVPFLLSLFIAVICSPPLLWLKQKGVPSALSLTIIMLSIVGIGLVIGMVAGSSINDFRGDLPEYQKRLEVITQQLQQFLHGLGIELNEEQWRQSFDPGVALALAGNTLASFGNVMGNAFMILLTVIFILAEEVRFGDKMMSAHPNAARTVTAMGRFTRSVNQYMAIKSGLSLLTGFLAMTWLWILGVDYPVLWGMLAFLLNFVPNLGSILAAIPAVLLALIQLGVPDAALTAAGYVVINVMVGNVIEPRMMGRGLDLSTLVVFLSLVFWGWVLGPVGMLLSVPLTMTVKIALESSNETRWLGVMLGSGRDISTEQVGEPAAQSDPEAL